MPSQRLYICTCSECTYCLWGIGVIQCSTVHWSPLAHHIGILCMRKSKSWKARHSQCLFSLTPDGTDCVLHLDMLIASHACVLCFEQRRWGYCAYRALYCTVSNDLPNHLDSDFNLLDLFQARVCSTVPSTLPAPFYSILSFIVLSFSASPDHWMWLELYVDLPRLSFCWLIPHVMRIASVIMFWIHLFWFVIVQNVPSALFKLNKQNRATQFINVKYYSIIKP